MSKRQAAKLRTQKSLLAAVREMTAEGAPLSIAAAARRAGIGVATAYRYYSDLDTLRSDAALDLRMDEGQPDFLAEFERRVAGISDPEERLVIAQRQMIGFVEGNDLDYRMFIAKAQEQHVREAAQGVRTVPKGGRRLMMIRAALSEVEADWPEDLYRDLVRSLLLITGPEPWLILRDYGNLAPDEVHAVNEQAVRDLYRAHFARMQERTGQA
ncbi:hypothetical protein [Frigidibacter sp. ROC022]|uniref:hypothetical protein n=1 Tax=Frigidibacter sp. ROC022 TaxID=2971796 RepID=UPI00215B539A|nr:hypothetical protein [Frigidibacter sp. ROC022]MCR8725954.1 hypothetical protein [Frigidibacter sp. ROC022]